LKILDYATKKVAVARLVLEALDYNERVLMCKSGSTFCTREIILVDQKCIWRHEEYLKTIITQESLTVCVSQT
jgi:hypothetical protein